MKKWSYAAAMMLAISSGCIFTGCIDNDEPYGIEQIRVATASLLEAKKNAVAAEAAAANANLEIAKIQAEIDKLKVENEKIIAESQAKINEAQAEAELLKAKAEAALTEAQAAQFNAMAEEALARANDQKARTEAYIKDQEATLNEKIGLAEANVKTAQLEYDKALYYFEQEKAKHLSEANDALWGAVAGAFNNYLTNLDAYNQANRKYLKAVQELAKQNTNIEWNENEGKFTSLAWDQKASIEKEIARINNDLAVENNKVAEVEEFNQKLADIKDADPKGLYTLLSDYEDKLTDATAAKTEAEAALQALKLNNKDIMEAPDNIKKEIEALNDKKMDVPAWTYEPIPQLQPLGAPWDKPQEIVGEHQTYTFSDQTSYQNWVNVYQSAINRISTVFLDDNDKLWTQATLNELARKINPMAQKVTKAWSNAKEVYNMGEAAQPLKAPLGAELKAAADASNAANTALLAANRAYYAAEAAYDEAVVAYNEALGKYNKAASDAYQAASETYDADREKIDAAYEEAEQAARTARETADAAIPGKIAALQPDVDKAMQAYETARVEADGNEADPKVVEAKAAYDAVLAKQNALYSEYSTNWNAYEEAVNKATEKQRKDLDAATEAWVKAQQTWAHAYDAEVMNADPLVKPSYTAKEEKDKAMQEALEAFVEKKEEANDAYGEFQDIRNDQLTAINKMYNGDYNFYYDDPNESGRSVSYALYMLSNFKATENSTSPEVLIPFAYQVDGVYTIAKAYVVNASQYTFGRLGDWDGYDFGSDYNQDLAILLPIDFANPMANKEAIFKIFNDYIIAINQYSSPWSYQNEYWRFGAYSSVLVDMYDYNIGTICVAGDFESIVNDLLAEPKANLESMETAHKDVADQLDEKKRELADAEKAAQDLTDAAQANIDAAQETWNTINGLIGTLKQGIAQLEAIAIGSMPPYDAAQIVEGMIDENNEKLAAAQKLIEELNAQLEEINYIKGQYEGENGYASLINPYTYQVDYLKTKVENAKSLMEFAKARYEELQAKYEAANK